MNAITGDVQAIPFADFKQEFMPLYGPRFRAPSTRKGMEYTLRLLDSLGVETTADFTVPLITRLIESRPREHSDHTLKGLLLRVQAVVSYAEKAGYLPGRNPFRVRPIKTWVRPARAVGKKHLTRDEIKAILGLARRDSEDRRGWAQWRARRLHCAVAVAAYTGLRKMEIFTLQVIDVNLPARSIDVVDRVEHRCKTPGSAQPVPIPEALVPILEMWIHHRLDAPPGFDRPASLYLFPTIATASPWISGCPGGKPLDRLKAVAARAGVAEGVTWHALRRSIATHLEAHGAGPAMIQRLLRHTSPETTERWYRKADLHNMLATVGDFQY